MPSFRMPLVVTCALAPNAMPDSPAKRATPIAMLTVLPGSTCGSIVSAVAAAIPCRAIWLVCWTACWVCASCEPSRLSWLCWPEKDCDIEVDSAFNWLRLTASVPSVPAATLVIWRCWVELPTDTTLDRPPSVEPWPSATEFEPALTDGAWAPGADMSAA